MNLRQELSDKQKDLDRCFAENALLQRNVDELNTKLTDMAGKLGVAQEALQFLEDVANSRRGSMKTKIEAVVSEALRLIYGEDYGVELVYDVKNNRSTLDIKLERETKAGKVSRSMGGFGGGVADTISVPLRLLVILGSQQTDRVAVLDEPYKHIDLERVELAASFLKDICEKLQMQVILLSHHEVMRESADRIYELSESFGRSVLKESQK